MDPFIVIPLEKEIPDSFFVSYIDGQLCPETTVAHRLLYNRMILVQSGSGTLHIDDVDYNLSENQLFLMSKGQVLSFSGDCIVSGFNLGFGESFWKKTPSSANNCKAVLFNNASDNQLLSLSTNDRTELCFLFESLWKEFDKSSYINKLDALAAYLKIIMIKVANVNASLAQGFDSYEKQVYRQFLELISVNYHSSHEVSTYAAKMGISARKLTDISKRCSGKGAKDLINGQVIAEAKRSLQFSSRPVKEIAYELNFSTPDQFSHFFKKNTSVSPQDYRIKFVSDAS